MKFTHIRGFTLIEVVIVIAIIASFTGLVSANYVQYAEERKLAQEVINLKSVLAVARTKSMNGDVGTYPCGTFYGYRVSSELATRRYLTHICCGTSCSDTGSAAYETAAYTLPQNIELRTSFNIAFLSFAKGTDLAEDAAIEIKNTAIGKCAIVRVSQIGLIESGALYSC